MNTARFCSQSLTFTPSLCAGRIRLAVLTSVASRPVFTDCQDLHQLQVEGFDVDNSQVLQPIAGVHAVALHMQAVSCRLAVSSCQLEQTVSTAKFCSQSLTFTPSLCAGRTLLISPRV